MISEVTQVILKRAAKKNNQFIWRQQKWVFLMLSSQAKKQRYFDYNIESYYDVEKDTTRRLESNSIIAAAHNYVT